MFVRACRSALAEEDGKVTIFGGFVAGFGSGITEAVLIVTPFEVIKTRLQGQKGSDVSKLKYKGLTHCASTVVKEEGALALWKGLLLIGAKAQHSAANFSGNIPTMARQGINQLMLFGDTAR